MPPPSQAPDQTLSILYRDDDLVIVSKPSGLLVHRGGWDSDRVVAMTLLRDALGQRVFPAHRLDRATSGALVFALSSEAARAVQEAWEAGLVHKRYLALVRGWPQPSGLIDHAVPSEPRGPRVAATTGYTRLQTYRVAEAPGERYSLVQAEPRTGRLHQIRRHMKHLSHPLVGDVNYGKGDINRYFRERFGLRRLALHASAISLPHPVTGERLHIEAPVPEDLRAPLEALASAAASSGSPEEPRRA